MARHVDPDDHSFRNSLLRAAAGGLAALVITFAVTALLTYLGRGRNEDSPAVTFTGVPTEPVPSAQPEPSPTPSPERTEPIEPSQSPTPQEATETPTGVVTVQVLDAVGSGTSAQEAAEVLRDLGYEVVVVNSTPRRLDTTTVMFTEGHADDAEALRDADERFGELQPNVDFNPAVDLHVLVGTDFSGEAAD